MRVEVFKCTCTHEYQDSIYGKQMRVMNPQGKLDKGSAKGTHKCSVCSRFYTIKRG